MPFSYYDRLSPSRKKIYRLSDGIATLGIPRGQDHGAAVLRIEAALRADDRASVQRECQALLDVLAAGYRVPKLRLRVLARSEEHTSELQSRVDLVCRLLLEKKK